MGLDLLHARSNRRRVTMLHVGLDEVAFWLMTWWCRHKRKRPYN